jgi:hypothetical protein
VAHDVRQLAGCELAASTGAVAELGQPNPVALVGGFVEFAHRHPLSSGCPASFADVEIDHQFVGDRFERARRSAGSVSAGTRRVAVASKSDSPDIGADDAVVSSSSMLTLRCASAPAISRMMPGRSCPIRWRLRNSS